MDVSRVCQWVDAVDVRSWRPDRVGFDAVGEEAEEESVGVCRVRESSIVGECNVIANAGVCVWGEDRTDRSSRNTYCVNQPAIFLTEASN